MKQLKSSKINQTNNIVRDMFGQLTNSINEKRIFHPTKFLGSEQRLIFAFDAGLQQFKYIGQNTKH